MTARVRTRCGCAATLVMAIGAALLAQPDAARAQATLPTSFSGSGWTNNLPAGWTHTGMGSDYVSNYDGVNGNAGKFDTTGDMLTIFFSGTPGTLSYYLGGNSLSGAYVFNVEESADGSIYTALRTFSGSGIAASPGGQFTNTPASTSRYIRFRYGTKVTGNVGIDGVSITAASAPASNQPPTIAAIADPIVTVNADLAFLVSATNPDPGDVVTLWATNLPDNATFATTNDLGSASNVFAWVGATPQGDFPVTFVAADKDGTNTLDITIQVVPPGTASEMILSEYGEGSSNNKFIELFNGTGRALNLGDYSLRIFRNQTNTPSDTLALSGSLGHGIAYVIVNRSADNATLLGQADLLSSSSVMTFNGDDAVGLYKGSTLIDIVGSFFSGSWGQDKVLVRNSNIVAPTNEYDALQWTEYPKDTYGDVGLHNMDGLGSQPPAIAAESANVYGYEGLPLSFTVSASDAADGDQITLLGAGLPIGSQFPTVIAQTAVQGTFTWNNPFPAGTYYPLFQAIDKDGTNTQQVTLRIYLPLSSNQTLVAHFNEVEADDGGTDDGEFVELIGHAGVDLQGCKLVHLDGSTGDGGAWTFTFPAATNSIFPDDGIIDTNGIACGFIVLAQPGGTMATNCDFLMPVDPSATNTNLPLASLQNGPDGLILYDIDNNVLDAISWGDFGAPELTGDILLDDPGAGVVSRTVPSTWAPFLHYMLYDRSDNTPQAPNDVIGDTGVHWEALNPTPHALNAAQVNGSFILIPQAPPPPVPPSGLILLVW